MINYYKPLIAAVALCTTTFTAHFSAQAEEWKPSGPITMYVAFAAGGGADTQARLIAQGIEDKYGWKIIPQQAQGNSGLALAAKLAQAPADGTAIGMAISETLTYSAQASGDPSFALEKFTALATTAQFQMGLVAMNDGDFDSWEKVKAAGKAGKKIRFATASDRQADMAWHLGKKSGLDFNIVEVRGGKGVMNGLRGGDVDIGWVAGAQSKSVKQGELTNIARGIQAPLVDTPDAPVITDLGSEFLLDGYFMFIAPGNMDPAARKALGDAIRSVAEDSSTKANSLLTKAFNGASVITGDKLDVYMKQSNEDATKLMKAVAN